MVFWMCECPVTKYYSKHHLQSCSVLLCSNVQTGLLTFQFALLLLLLLLLYLFYLFIYLCIY